MVGIPGGRVGATGAAGATGAGARVGTAGCEGTTTDGTVGAGVARFGLATGVKLGIACLYCTSVESTSALPVLFSTNIDS